MLAYFLKETSYNLPYKLNQTGKYYILSACMDALDKIQQMCKENENWDLTSKFNQTQKGLVGSS